MTHMALIASLAIEGLCCLTLLGALAVAMLKQSREARRREEAIAVAPAVREAVTTYLCGNSDLTELRQLTARSAAQVEESILGFQARLGGNDRERLGELAVNLGFVSSWCDDSESADLEVRRRGFVRLAALAQSEAVRRMIDDLPERGLKDADPMVRLESARALLESGSDRALDLAFEAALTFTPLAQLEIASLLRRHAMRLCESIIPRALRNGSVNQLLVTLPLLNSWECALPLADIGSLACHPDPRVRLEIMRLLSLVPPTPANRRALLTGLADSDLEVNLAAVAALDRLKMRAAMPHLTSCLRRGSESLARAAAGVLGTMGGDGLRALEGQLPNPDPIASGAAREVLERFSGMPSEACA